MKNSDDHERNLSGEENCNDHNQHQGCTLGISLLTTFPDPAAAGNKRLNQQEIGMSNANLPLFLLKDQFSSLCPPLPVKLELKVLPLVSLLLLRSAVLRAEQRSMLSTTREMQGIRWTKRTRNLDSKNIFLNLH